MIIIITAILFFEQRILMIFNEACNQIGYNPDYSKAPKRIYKYFAYKDGQTFECSSKEEAQKLIILLNEY